jgi:hypothetical protein
LPALGGDASIISPDTGAFLWAEGDNLLYAPSGVTGCAASRPVARRRCRKTGGYCAPRAGGWCDGVLRDGDLLKFNAYTTDGPSVSDIVVRRMSRATGMEEDLASIPLGGPTS